MNGGSWGAGSWQCPSQPCWRQKAVALAALLQLGAAPWRSAHLSREIAFAHRSNLPGWAGGKEGLCSLAVSEFLKRALLRSIPAGNKVKWSGWNNFTTSLIFRTLDIIGAIPNSRWQSTRGAVVHDGHYQNLLCKRHSTGSHNTSGLFECSSHKSRIAHRETWEWRDLGFICTSVQLSLGIRAEKEWVTFILGHR